jgi:hypothetical protein
MESNHPQPMSMQIRPRRFERRETCGGLVAASIVKQRYVLALNFMQWNKRGTGSGFVY